LIRAPRFWHQPTGWQAQLLAPFGWVYGAVTAWRMNRPGVRADVPVICVGNLTVGGAGKTPTVLKLAALLKAEGRTPFILSRGYGGRARGPVRVDVGLHDAATVGDEPLMMAAHAPVIVARDRVKGAALAVQAGADVLLMDDGLQNPALTKDFTLAVVDGGAGIGNGYVLPAGPLRAPLARQWPHVGAVLVIGAGAPGAAVTEAAKAAGKPVLCGTLRLDDAAVAQLAGQPLLAFAGIGRPEKFFDSLREAGLDLCASRAFGDHHPYTAANLASLQAEARAEGLTLVTTQKDAARLPASFCAYVPVSLELDAQAIKALLATVLKTSRSEP
jgi:tetraacyldisaccharide 4'-kinase